MALDFSVLEGIDPGGAFMQGRERAAERADRNLLRQMQMEQMAAQRENMLAQRQQRLEEAEMRRRAGEAQNALATYAASGQPMTPAALGRFGEPGIKLAEALRKQQADQIEQEVKVLDYATRRLAAANPQTYPAIRADLARINPQFAAGLPEQFDAEQVMSLARQGLSLKEQIESATKETVLAPGASLYRGGRLVATAPAAEKPYEPSELQKTLSDLKAAPPGSPEARALQARVQMLTTREPKEPKEPPAPIPVVDPATGQVKYVPREQAVGMTPPAFMESLTPKERQVREAKFPQATSALKAFDNTATTLIKDLETLANHPGLPSITGIAAGRLPGITSQGREAQALYDKIMARGGFQELQNMRQASPTGGALGNVSNAEGQRLQAAFAALDRTQDAPSVRKAIRDAITQTQAAKQNLREAYDLTYEYKQRGGASPAAAPAAPNIDDLLNKYR